MKLPVVWLPEADADVKEVRAWYDGVRPALGEQFALAIDAAVEAIALKVAVSIQLSAFIGPANC